jgi:hypothetical protein
MVSVHNNPKGKKKPHGNIELDCKFLAVRVFSPHFEYFEHTVGTKLLYCKPPLDPMSTIPTRRHDS